MYVYGTAKRAFDARTAEHRGTVAQLHRTIAILALLAAPTSSADVVLA